LVARARAGEVFSDCAGSTFCSTRGKYISKFVPLPGEVSTLMHPPLCLTMPYTIARPIPGPLPFSFVVKNGSNIRALISLFIPWPVLVTVST
jgi:hypothetical protein